MSSTVKYAGFWPRLLAHNIDLMPILLMYYIFSFLIPNLGFDYLLIGSIYMLYHLLFESSKWAATPGKKFVKLKVVNNGGSHLSIIQGGIRNLTKILSLVLFFGGFILIGFDAKKKGLHDYLGKTLVIFDED